MTRSLLILFLALHLSLGCGETTSPPPTIQQQVEASAGADLKKLVKSPATFDLVSCQVSHEGAAFWIASGDFDAQNSFGALLRSSYTAFYRELGETPALWCVIIDGAVVFQDARGLELYQAFRDPQRTAIDAENDRIMDSFRTGDGSSPDQ